MKAQISNDGSTRSAIGRIVTVYRVVRTVPSTLEGKAHFDFTAERQDTPATPLALTLFTLSELFRCAISPQFMGDNDLDVWDTSPCTFEFVGKETGGGGQISREICHVNNTWLSIRDEGVKRCTCSFLRAFQTQESPGFGILWIDEGSRDLAS